MNFEPKYLQRTLELARLGGISAFPNPLVGSVVVHDDKIIGEGFHQQYGGPHAEVNAVNGVNDKSLLKTSTLYISLEPCNFYGKTPPCSKMILEQGIPKIVVGSLDPNPRVAGKSVDFLRSQGVEVAVNPEPEPFEKLNRSFWVNQIENRPYILLKWAQSKDGFIAAHGPNETPLRTSITGPRAQKLVHRLRSSHHAIMVGANTASIDLPSLTNRKFPGENPVRILFDNHLRLTPAHPALRPPGRVILLNTQKEGKIGHITYLKIAMDGNKPAKLAPILADLYRQEKIGSILVEGGPNVLQQFLDGHLYDEIVIGTSPLVLDKGVSAPTLSETITWTRKFDLGPDQFKVFPRPPGINP